MAVLNLINAHLAFGHVALLDGVDFALEANERVGLIGRNGTGKSSFIKILAGRAHADDGQLHIQQGARIAYVEQEPRLEAAHTVFEAVAEGLSDVRRAIDHYASGTAKAEELHDLQTQIETNDGWNWERRVEEALTRLQLNGQTKIADLSGGGKKRVALAQALVARPEVLLLDEPTNHLDLQAIKWLEVLLQEYTGSVVVVTHDRSFLDAVATRIVELDRGMMRSYPGNFAAYQNQKEEELAAEALQNARADKLLAEEEVWIRKGVEARRTRSVARIARLERLRLARQTRREQVGQVKLAIDAAQASGKIVAELEGAFFAYGEKNTTQSTKQQVRDFSAIFLRGDKIGLIGPNGAGKTTLLRLILGELKPQQGHARQGSKLQVAYFDQMRDTLDLDASLQDFISPGSEWIEIAGKRKHVRSYLSDFLFAAERAQSPVRSLSGGERNRLLLARLFALPANVLVLDEPTNDLDIDTLDLLEDLLQNYAGTVFLVSHDRSFLNNVVTSTIAFEGDGVWREYEGGVDDYLLQQSRAAKNKNKENSKTEEDANSAHKTVQDTATIKSAVTASKPARKLSYKEEREKAAIPMQITALEEEQSTIRKALEDPAIYTTRGAEAAKMHARDAAIDDEILALMQRQEELET